MVDFDFAHRATKSALHDSTLKTLEIYKQLSYMVYPNMILIHTFSLVPLEVARARAKPKQHNTGLPNLTSYS